MWNVRKFQNLEMFSRNFFVRIVEIPRNDSSKLIYGMNFGQRSQQMSDSSKRKLKTFMCENTWKFRWVFGSEAVQMFVNLLDLAKSFLTSIYLQNWLRYIQERASQSLPKIDKLLSSYGIKKLEKVRTTIGPRSAWGPEARQPFEREPRWLGGSKPPWGNLVR